VIIAGIPIATVASAIARASIMTFPLIDKLQQISIGSLRNRFANQHLPHVCFRRISPPKVLVSRFVATIGRAFRGLWRESDMGAQVECRSALVLLRPPLEERANGRCPRHRSIGYPAVTQRGAYGAFRGGNARGSKGGWRQFAAVVAMR
jgi:hypothetical protein